MTRIAIKCIASGVSLVELRQVQREVKTLARFISEVGWAVSWQQDLECLNYSEIFESDDGQYKYIGELENNIPSISR